MMQTYSVTTDNAALGLTRQFHAAIGKLHVGQYDKGTRAEVGIGETVQGMLSACYDLIRDEEAGYTICTYSRHNSTRNDFSMLATMRSIAKETQDLPRTSTILLGAGAGAYLEFIGQKLKKENVLPQNATSGDVYTIAARCMRKIQSRMIENDEKLGIYKPVQGVTGRLFADINFGI